MCASKYACVRIRACIARVGAYIYIKNMEREFMLQDLVTSTVILRSFCARVIYLSSNYTTHDMQPIEFYYFQIFYFFVMYKNFIVFVLPYHEWKYFLILFAE